MNTKKPFKFCTPSQWFTRKVKFDVIGVGGTGSEVLASLARINYCSATINLSGRRQLS
jgi:molybdopterin/thiamine biosynthesis adenylyltransferase